MTNSCQFTPCRHYRYTLEHVTDPLAHAASPRRIQWIGLNPSVADEQQLDPTLRRIRRFSADWGFTAFVMTNLFAYRATDPRDMMAIASPAGPDNLSHLIRTAQACETVVAAWGAHGTHHDRALVVAALFSRERIHLQCLGLTKSGQPKHPLYVKATCPIVRFRPEEAEATGSASGCTQAAKAYAAKRTIENAIEEAARDLPKGWKIVLSMERGAAWVEAVRPDESVVPIDPCDGDLYDCIRDAGRLAVDEAKCDSSPNIGHEPRAK